MSQGTFPSFKILESTPYGRLGVINTAHGTIHTPEFVFCGTKGSVKCLCPWELESLGAQIILSNTYHMLVYPGISAIEELQGIHSLSGWNGPMLTDSGGFQLFCLGGHGSVHDEIKGKVVIQNPTVLRIDEEGAIFRSYRDGSQIFLTPELSLEMQSAMGADLVVNFDECTPSRISPQQTKESLQRTNRWQYRGLLAFKRFSKSYQGLYGVVQGGIYPELRKLSIDYCNEHDFFGYALGGSLGRTLQDAHKVMQVFAAHKISTRPAHLLGMGGKIREIFELLRYGIDTFDCVHPTRVARHGVAICPHAVNPCMEINLHRATKSLDPIDKNCLCQTCKHFSKMALHTLLRLKETTAIIAITEHNVYTMLRLTRDIRRALMYGRFLEVQNYWTGNSMLPNINK